MDIFIIIISLILGFLLLPVWFAAIAFVLGKALEVLFLPFRLLRYSLPPKVNKWIDKYIF